MTKSLRVSARRKESLSALFLLTTKLCSQRGLQTAPAEARQIKALCVCVYVCVCVGGGDPVVRRGITVISVVPCAKTSLFLVDSQHAMLHAPQLLVESGSYCHGYCLFAASH